MDQRQSNQEEEIPPHGSETEWLSGAAFATNQPVKSNYLLSRNTRKALLINQ